jgi:hypothetical protein
VFSHLKIINTNSVLLSQFNLLARHHRPSRVLFLESLGDSLGEGHVFLHARLDAGLLFGGEIFLPKTIHTLPEAALHEVVVAGVCITIKI